jgi:hypothetical protein
MNSFLTSLPLLLPVVVAWVEKQELIISERGTPLNDAELADARRAGVSSPEKIRVLRVDTLPQPDDEDVMFVAKRIGFFGSRSAGLSLRYGICLVHGSWEDRHVLVHECVHVGQYERMGGIRPFLSVYLRECIDPGYPFGALEQEAILVSADICKPVK